MPQLPTIEDSTYPAKSRPRRRYFRASLPALVERRGCCGGARQHGVTTATCTSTPQTFTELAAASRRTGIFVVVLPHLRCLHSCILYSFDFESSPSVRAGSSGGSARTRGAPERVFAEPGATAAPLRDPRPAAAAAAAVRSALERARPARRARACPCLLSPLSLPATHPLPAGAGRFG